MNDTIGSAQTSNAATSVASVTKQNLWMARFISPLLAAQTITAGLAGWSLHVGMSESNTNAVATLAEGCCYIWRPSNGAKPGTLWDRVTSSLGGPGATGEVSQTGSPPQVAQPSVTCQDGDVLVYEVWFTQTQGMSTSYTDTFFYDGTTENSTTSNAAYLLAPADLPLFTAPAAPERAVPNVVSQAVQRAASRCWARRPSGIVVPRLWTPEGATI